MTDKPIVTFDFALPEKTSITPAREMIAVEADGKIDYAHRVTRIQNFYGFEKGSYVFRIQGDVVLVHVTCRASDGNHVIEYPLDEKRAAQARELLAALYDEALQK